jgi:hypothetical protein
MPSTLTMFFERTRIAQRAVITALLLAIVLASSQPAVAEPEIKWRVTNPFRLFTDPTNSEVHRATFDSLTEDERKTPILSAERALAERHPDGWAASMWQDACWDANKNRYACPALNDYVNPKSHKIRAQAVDIPDGNGVDCTWLSAPKGGRKRGAAITVPCDTPVELEIPFPAGAMITVEVGGQQIAQTTVNVDDVFIVGMGDSFGSGEGNPDVAIRLSAERSADYGIRSKDQPPLAGYPARAGNWAKIGDKDFISENPHWMDQACHRSLYSHQLRAALQLGVEDSHRAVTFVGFACSGAETIFGAFLRYKGHEWVPSPPELSQISAAAAAQCGAIDAPLVDLPEAYHMGGRLPELMGGLVLKKCPADKSRKIDLLFLSLGGNDIGFSRLVANAVLADQSSLRSLGGWFGQVQGIKEAQTALDVLSDRYKALNRAFHALLHVPWVESDRVILTAYPPLVLLEDGRSLCPDGTSGMTVLSDFHLSQAKSGEASVAAERLQSIMRDSAHKYGWSFADAHRADFRGRGLCAGWSRDALNTADDLRLPRLVDGKWEPYNPSEWRPYATRQRWFRTPNDSFLTGHFHVPQSLLQSALRNQGYEWVQLLLASTYSGSFHPTAEGNAAIADSLAARSRDVLAKYERRNTPRQAAKQRGE